MGLVQDPRARCELAAPLPVVRAQLEDQQISASVAEVAEGEGDAEVLLAQRGDDGLEVVALLAADPELVGLRLAGDALHPEGLDELVELTGLVRGDAGGEGDDL